MSKGDLSNWIATNPQDAIRKAKWAKMLRVRAARENVNVFIEYVMKDEETGKPIIQAPHHVLFQQLAEANPRLILWSFVEAGKTQQLSVGRTLWELGKNPNLRFAIACGTERAAYKILSNISSYIEGSEELHEVFPKLREGKKWSGGAITILRDSYAKDPSVQAVPTTGKVLGARLDRFILDDFLTWDGAFNEKERQHLWNWYHGTLVGRLTSGARGMVLGNAFHPQDFMHQLEKNPTWTSKRVPLLVNGQSIWPSRWSQERIDARRLEVVPDEFARQILCVARDDASARFKKAWIDLCMANGEGKRIAKALVNVPYGFRIFTGVDIGIGKKQTNAATVFFTIGIHPDGTREVLCVEAGRWAGPEILNKVLDTHNRFQSIIIIEENAAQRWMVQFTKAISSVPVRAFNTGKNKTSPDFGIESLAVEMANGKWVIPNEGGVCHPEVRMWIDEMLQYDPAAHTGDRLMAAWIAREGTRIAMNRTGVAKLDLMRR